ncbi:hypothetical protein M0804_014488 [Polistes exclamans]|nr:hypothetical protein M0804_014489 [Polistes exclamans]KAI4475147.1 hypothetical protein M0804_014488 [Polistes exclamans]
MVSDGDGDGDDASSGGSVEELHAWESTGGEYEKGVGRGSRIGCVGYCGEKGKEKGNGGRNEGLVEEKME